jgi:hypothetical protein
MTRRIFAMLLTTVSAAVAPVLIAGDIAASSVAPSDAAKPEKPGAQASVADSDKLQSEVLFDLVFDKGPANNVGSPGVNRVVVPVSGGTFEGPALKGTVVGPSGDWIVTRPDGSSVLDMRIVLQTDDAQKIYMTCRGVAFAQPDGTLYARILPVFETGSSKYVWLNKILAVGVYRPVPGKVAYRIYRIL